MIDYAQRKMERTEFLAAMSTYIQSAQGMIKELPPVAPLIFQMMKWGLAGFKGAQEIEGVMDQAIDVATKAAMQPKPEEQNTRLAEIQAKAQADAQLEQQKHQNKMQEMAAEFMIKQAETGADMKASEFQERIQAYYNIMEKTAASDNKIRELRAKPAPKSAAS